MHEIEMQEVTPDFAECWKAAGQHLQKQVDGGISWLRSELQPPFLEHLSFRLGNQLFFIRIEDVDQIVKGPGALNGLNLIADGCNGHACVMPMQRRVTREWAPVLGGWGLKDAKTHETIDPVSLISDEKIEMTPWEVHDFAVDVVCETLKKDGYKLMSSHGNPSVDPAIWFVGDSGKPEWVVIRAVRYPENYAERPANWDNIADNCAILGKTGHFASVAFVSDTQPFKDDDEEPVPLWRGHGVYVNFSGLE